MAAITVARILGGKKDQGRAVGRVKECNLWLALRRHDRQWPDMATNPEAEAPTAFA
jgi:hypothetical protein